MSMDTDAEGWESVKRISTLMRTKGTRGSKRQSNEGHGDKGGKCAGKEGETGEKRLKRDKETSAVNAVASTKPTTAPSGRHYRDGWRPRKDGNPVPTESDEIGERNTRIRERSIQLIDNQCSVIELFKRGNLLDNFNSELSTVFEMQYDFTMHSAFMLQCKAIQYYAKCDTSGKTNTSILRESFDAVNYYMTGMTCDTTGFDKAIGAFNDTYTKCICSTEVSMDLSLQSNTGRISHRESLEEVLMSSIFKFSCLGERDDEEDEEENDDINRILLSSDDIECIEYVGCASNTQETKQRLIQIHSEFMHEHGNMLQDPPPSVALSFNGISLIVTDQEDREHTFKEYPPNNENAELEQYTALTQKTFRKDNYGPHPYATIQYDTVSNRWELKICVYEGLEPELYCYLDCKNLEGHMHCWKAIDNVTVVKNMKVKVCGISQLFQTLVYEPIVADESVFPHPQTDLHEVCTAIQRGCEGE